MACRPPRSIEHRKIVHKWGDAEIETGILKMRKWNSVLRAAVPMAEYLVNALTQPTMPCVAIDPLVPDLRNLDAR
jgi:hypothetical protein